MFTFMCIMGLMSHRVPSFSSLLNFRICCLLGWRFDDVQAFDDGGNDD